VARDLDLGRVYLPAEDCTRFGYSDEDLCTRRFTPAFADLLRFEVERTRDLFYRGFPLVELMPAGLRIDIELFIQYGLRVLRRIERASFDVWARRPKLSKAEKLWLLVKALWSRLW
jgi:phytoene/squalene synthetase